MGGTRITVPFDRIVDGDTIRVLLDDGNGGAKSESLRILALDTEESNAGGSKPVTPLGHAAKAEAGQFFDGVAEVTLEFPSDDPIEVCLTKHRGNFGRLLVYVHKGDVDFQEHMIETGFSPYFVKYGYAEFEDKHLRYTQAEREAQSERKGVWNQIEGNNSVINNYAALTAWWHLRGRVIDDYRRLRGNPATILNTRLDYAELLEKASQNETVMVFSELREMTRVGQVHMLVRIGSRAQPFQLFIPNFESPVGQKIINLLTERYIPSGLDEPRRGYAFISGQLDTFQSQPDRPPIVEITIESPDQITDAP